MDKNLYSAVNSGSSKIMDYIKSTISKYLIFIVLLFNIALQVVSNFYKIGFKNPFSVEFFLELGVSMLTTMLCYICFIPFGKQEEIRSNPSYSQNISVWSKLSAMVRNGFNEIFRNFCREQLNEERDDIRRVIIGNNTMIDYNVYCEKYRGKSKEYINALIGSELTKKEANTINRANGNCFFLFSPVRVAPIDPLIILSGSQFGSINDAGRKKSSFVLRWLLERPFFIFLSTTIINAMSTTFIGGGTNAIFDIFLSTLSIVIASVCGYSAGVSSVRFENDKVKSRIIFLSMFAEKNNLPMPKAEQK